MSTGVKMFLSFIAGGVCTVIAFFGVALFSVKNNNNSVEAENKDLVIFESPQQKVDVRELVVFQVLPNGNALARPTDIENISLVVLLLSEDNVAYYDKMKIKLNRGESFMQVGIFKYNTKNDFEKTVPVVKVVKDI